MDTHQQKADINPPIPIDTLRDDDIAFLARFGFKAEDSLENGMRCRCLTAQRYKNPTRKEGATPVHFGAEDLAKRLKQIISRSRGQLKYLYVNIIDDHGARTPGNFGAETIFVTESQCHTLSTQQWLGRQIKKHQRKTDSKAA